MKCNKIERIDNTWLDKIEKINLSFDYYYDSVYINAKDIKDIYFDGFSIQEPYSTLHCSMGRLVLDKACFNNEMREGKENYFDCKWGENMHVFSNRALARCDIDVIHIYLKNGEDFNFYPPYNPLYSSVMDEDIEFTNIPSATINCNGDMLIGFGSHSLSKIRDENNYECEISGFTERFKTAIVPPLKMQIISIKTMDEYYCERLYVYVRLRNENYLNRRCVFTFCDAKEIKFNMKIADVSKGENIELRIARMLNGRMFVSFDDVIEFKCSDISMDSVANYEEYFVD